MASVNSILGTLVAVKSSFRLNRLHTEAGEKAHTEWTKCIMLHLRSPLLLFAMSPKITLSHFHLNIHYLLQQHKQRELTTTADRQ